MPLATSLSTANRHDSGWLFALLAALPACLRREILSLHANRAYDNASLRIRLKREGIKPFPAKRGTGLRFRRWVVEHTIAWLHQFLRLRIRYERHGYMHRVFLSLAASIIMSHFL